MTKGSGWFEWKLFRPHAESGGSHAGDRGGRESGVLEGHVG